MNHLSPGERRELAIHLGDDAARLEAGVTSDSLLDARSQYDAPARRDDELDHGDPRIEGWASALSRWGQEACARGALACARLILPIWTAEFPRDQRLHLALETAARAAAARQWGPLPPRITAQIDACAAAVRAAHQDDVVRACRAASIAVDGLRDAASHAGLAAVFAFRVVGWASSEQSRRHAPGLAALWRALGQDPAYAPLLTLPRSNRPRAVVRMAVRRELLGR